MEKKLTREQIIERTSLGNVFVNVGLAAFKIITGLLTSSMAFVSEGANNAADALTSLMAFAGTKLAAKHPDEKHPFGYGRIEYLTGLAISGLILFTGAEMMIESIGHVFHPETMSVSKLSLVFLALSAVLKFFLGAFTIRTGKAVDSSALAAVGTECRNDSFVSVITILSSLLFLFFDFNIDAYAGILISVLILKAGWEAFLETVSEILGRPGDGELASELYREIRATKGVLNAADMMLHNYGPGAWSGSVNVEMDHSLTLREAYRILHELQLRIMHEKKVTMVFGIYAVDNDSRESMELRSIIAAFVRGEEHVRSYHAVYMESGTNRIYVDLVVDYELKDWEDLRARFQEYMQERCPGRDVELTVETEYV